jgi:hypothetical protein
MEPLQSASQFKKRRASRPDMQEACSLAATQESSLTVELLCNTNTAKSFNSSAREQSTAQA